MAGSLAEDPADADPYKVFQEPPVEEKGPIISLGDVLPRIKRSVKCPGESAIPSSQLEMWRKQKDDKFVRKEPKLYVLLFPGAMDSVKAGWARMEYNAPSYLEFATYEWPSHGVRSEEPQPTTTGELGADAFETFREAMLTGSFVLVGHSIGSNIAAYVGRRAGHELGRPPLASFHLDRPPPGTIKWNEAGIDLWRRDWMGLMKLNHGSSFAKAVEDKLYEGVEKSAEKSMYEDVTFNNDPIPFSPDDYKFPCPLFVLIAMHQPKYDSDLGPAPHHWSPIAQLKFCGLTYSEWKLSQFDEWKKWSDKKVTITKIDTNHMLIKEDDTFIGVLYRVAKDILKRAERRSVQTE